MLNQETKEANKLDNNIKKTIYFNKEKSGKKKVIGIISDTHDNIEEIKSSLNFFKQNKVEEIIHSGDLVSPDLIKMFNGYKMYFCLGNSDKNKEEIKENLLKQNSFFFDPFGVFEILNNKFAITHGNHKKILSDLIKANKYDFIITGHTHRIGYNQIGKTIIINPGAHNPRNTKDINRCVVILTLFESGEKEVRFYNILYNKYLNIKPNVINN